MFIYAPISFEAASTDISTTNDSNNTKDGLWVTAKLSVSSCPLKACLPITDLI